LAHIEFCLLNGRLILSDQVSGQKLYLDNKIYLIYVFRYLDNVENKTK